MSTKEYDTESQALAAQKKKREAHNILHCIFWYEAEPNGAWYRGTSHTSRREATRTAKDALKARCGYDGYMVVPESSINVEE
jgi:hypothetical protein